MSVTLPEERRPLVRFAAVGLAAWALATLAIRLAPLHALRIGPLGAVVAVVLALCLVVGLAALLLRDITPATRMAAMCAFVLPGMIGDALTTAFFGVVFPNLPSGSGGAFGALMLGGYSAMLGVSVALGSDWRKTA